MLPGARSRVAAGHPGGKLLTSDAWIDTVRIARDFGDVSRLWPEGVDHLAEAPWTWFHAVRLAQIYLSFEELPDDERPPKRIWDDSEALNEHFRWVKAERDRKYKTGGGSSGGGGDDEAAEDKRNSLTKDLVVG